MVPPDPMHPAADAPQTGGLPDVSPDGFEEQHPEEMDNVVPTRGYQLLPVVALGGSAGSLTALRTFLERMPPSPGLAFVVVQHLSPDHTSLLPELLQRHTPMPVHAVEDAMKLEANTVYVIPPGSHLTATDGRLKLTPLQAPKGRRVAVDLFFRSLADTHGPHATAVVLSGGDGDGAIGLKRIKERGGLTVAQDPEEAECRGMPVAAIETGMVDWVLPAEEMPGRIVGYHARECRLKLPPEGEPGPMKGEPFSVDQREVLLREVLAFLRMRTGRDFSPYKRATVVRRISRRMQVSGVEELEDYLTHLRTHPGEAGALLQDLLISVTNFFRDREAFEVVQTLIPELFKGKGPDDTVRVWCAACATGEEVYSMAMLLQEHARTLESPPRLQVFGCDLDDSAIQKARTGLYPEAIAADVSEERLRRFFLRESGGYRVRRELREIVLFAAHDLLKDAPFSRMDLVSCRNLLIYLNREAQARAIDIFHFALKPGGLLFLGCSETVEDGSPLFEPVDKKHRIYRNHPAPNVVVPVQMGTGEGAITRMLREHERLKAEHGGMPGRTFSPSPPAGEEVPGPPEDALAANELHFKLLAQFGPPSIVVNAAHDMVHVSENAGRFLQFPEGEPTRNLPLLVHPMLRVELRAALLRAAETGEPVDLARQQLELPGGVKAVNVHVCPAGALAPGYMLVLFDAHYAQESAGLPPPRPAMESTAVVQQLERELTRAQTDLRATVEQHEASTEELKASNEELQAMNEELRSTGEELETGREELQSVNEELTTVNAEFKNRVELLARANSDLQNLINATQIATVFLDREMQIMRYTPSAAPLFNLIPGDVGRPITHLKQRVDYPELVADARKVLHTLVPVERELRDDGRWLFARTLPYRTVDDHIAGVVLTFVDITERRRAEAALHGTEAWLGGQKEAFEAALKGAPLADSLAVLVRTAIDLAETEVRCAFYVANEEGTTLRHVVGMPKACAECVDNFKIGASSLACGLAVHLHQPVLTSDVRQDPRWKEWLWMAERYEYRAVFSFPIETADGGVAGSFAMYFRNPRVPTTNDRQTGTVLTQAAAVIIAQHQAAEKREREKQTQTT